MNRGYYPDEGGKISRSLRITFDTAKEYGLLEVKDPNEEITDSLEKEILKEIQLDTDVLGKLFPKQVRIGNQEDVPGEIFIENQSYCTTKIFGIYASLILAKRWEAYSLFPRSYTNYCKYKFGSSLITDKKMMPMSASMSSIFNMVLPEQEVFPYYCFGKDCNMCKHEKKCSTDYESALVENLHSYFEYREYDWIVQMKAVVQDIVSRLESNQEGINDDSIINEFKKEQRTITRKIHNTFPKVKRWAHISLAASIPTAALGAATGLPSITYFGATMAGVSSLANELVNYSENKYKWIGFIKKGTTTKRLK